MHLKRKRDGMRKSILAVIIFSALALVMFSVPFSHAAATAQIQQNNEVVISWDSVANATQYQVYQSSDNATWTLMTNTTATSVTENLTTSGTYYYKINALNATGAVLSTQYTNVKFYPPAAPTGLVATVSGGEVKLSWNAVANATGYYVYRGTSSGNETLLGSALNNSYTDNSIKAGTTYHYYVVAYNSTGQSQPSAEIQVTPTSGSGTVVLGHSNWAVFNTGLLYTSIVLVAIGIPLLAYGAQTHRDVGKYSFFSGIVLFFISWGVGKYDTGFHNLMVGNVALNGILLGLGLVFFVVGIVVTLALKDDRRMEEHLDVGRFSLAFGIALMIVSWLVGYIVH